MPRMTAESAAVVAPAVDRLRAHFVANPGARLTVAEAAKLLDVSEPYARKVLTILHYEGRVRRVASYEGAAA